MIIAPEDLLAWLKGFAFTQLVEMPIYRWAIPTKWRVAFLASAVTHPFVWFAFPWLSARFDLDWTRTMIAAELFAWSVEALVMFRICKITWKRAALVSLLANGASVTFGLAFRELTGWI